jgi:recombination protein RecA
MNAMGNKQTDRISVIRAVITAVEKQFGRGAIMIMGDRDTTIPVETISSGSLLLDAALGTGGLPKGRIVEIYGPESSGKTTVALHAIAMTQRSGGVCAFVDAEHALDPIYAGRLGVAVSDLLLSQPDCGEQALEIVDRLVCSGAIRLIVIDSVAALVPRAEIEGEMGDAHLGLQARLMSQAMRKLTGSAHRHGATILFINQTRQKIGVTYGSNLTTSGGNALKFYASVRLDIHRIGAIKEGEETIGNRTRVKVVKNKLAPPFREAEFEIIFGKGINADGELLDLAVERELISRSGTWYALGETRLGQGRGAACRWLAENPEARAGLLERVVHALPSATKEAA